MYAKDDSAHMAAALSLASRGLGATSPNPSVGCILVKDGSVVGRGWTQSGGRPHAETEALKRAGAEARGATAYITLEPCNHHGETPPCAAALIESGVSRAVIAVSDPDPLVSGAGIQRLRDAGVVTDVGVLAAEAARLNRGFFLKTTIGRPLVALKIATTLDGRIGLADGSSQWITNRTSRDFGHLLRLQHDSVMVGSGTVIADDPMLTCRLPGFSGMKRQPVRIVMDRRLRLSSTSQLATTAGSPPTWLFTSERNAEKSSKALRRTGVEILPVQGAEDDGQFVHRVMTKLGALGLTRVLVESGGRLAASLIKEDLIDVLHWFRAPNLIGDDGRASIGDLGLDQLMAAPRFSRLKSFDFDGDSFETFERTDRP